MYKKSHQALADIAAGLRKYRLQYEHLFVDTDVSTCDIIVDLCGFPCVEERTRLENLARELELNIIGTTMNSRIRLQWW